MKSAEEIATMVLNWTPRTRQNVYREELIKALEAYADSRLEEAARIVKDGHKSSKCVDPDDCPYCCFSKAILAIKSQPSGKEK